MASQITQFLKPKTLQLSLIPFSSLIISRSLTNSTSKSALLEHMLIEHPVFPSPQRSPQSKPHHVFWIEITSYFMSCFDCPLPAAIAHIIATVIFKLQVRCLLHLFKNSKTLTMTWISPLPTPLSPTVLYLPPSAFFSANKQVSPLHLLLPWVCSWGHWGLRSLPRCLLLVL